MWTRTGSIPQDPGSVSSARVQRFDYCGDSGVVPLRRGSAGSLRTVWRFVCSHLPGPLLPHPTLLIVSIYVLKLALMADRRQILCGSRKRRGEIYLEDSEEEAVYIIRKPIFLRPHSRNFSPSFQTQFRDGDKDKDTVVETEEFKYDCEAFEKV